VVTYRPYTPPAWQVKPLADGRVTLLVVPIRPARGYQSTWLSPEILQAAPSCYLIENNGRLGTQMQHPKANQDSPMSPLTWVPLLYAPGDLIWCREAWNITHTSDLAPGEVIGKTADECAADNGGFATPCGDGVVYRSEGAESHPVYGKAIWRSPVTMPKWAARTWLRCIGVEVRRVQTISEDEAIANGILENRLNCYGPDCPIDQLRSCNTHGCWGIREDFSQRFPNFDANPWAAFVAVEKISKEYV